VLDAEHSTPLMRARAAAVVKLLLAAGADATVVGGKNWTALHCYAAAGASSGFICLILKAGADPTAVDSDGSTAAHLAGIKGHFALEALLSRAADDYRKKQTTTSSSSSGSTGSSNTTVTTASDYSSEHIVQSSASSSDAATAASTDDDNTREQQADASHDTTASEQQQQRKAHKAKQPCANCSKLTTKRCRGCAVVYYCSEECQKVCFKDPQHRAQCEAKAAEIISA
jgi:ankyrin repeat protein